MALSPDKVKVPLSQLAKSGMCHIDTRGIEFDPPVGNRGLQRGTKVTMWKCSITTVDAARPTIVAIRSDPDDAENAAKALFVEMMTKKDWSPARAVSVPEGYDKPSRAAPKNPGPTAAELAKKLAEKATPAVEDDDIEDLI